MDWLKMYAKYTEKHEAPSCYHLWTGISVIAGALERKVWTRLMFDNIYPNMYVILVGPPGRCRKSSAISIGTRLLKELPGVHFSSERITPEALIKDLADSESVFYMGRTLKMHSSLTAVSKELGTFLSMRLDDMLILLTDLYDSQSHDTWTYSTKGAGVDKINGVWLNILGGTVPSFFMTRQIQESIGLGFTSRCIFIFADKTRKRSLAIDNSLQGKLISALNKIHELCGEFKFKEDAWSFYEDWYLKLPADPVTIESLEPYHERKHVHVLKLAMILSASEGGNGMYITKNNIIAALNVLKDAEEHMPRVFRGTGRLATSADLERILDQIRRSDRPLSEKEILRKNYMHVTPAEIAVILETLTDIREVRMDLAGSMKMYSYLGEAKYDI